MANNKKNAFMSGQVIVAAPGGDTVVSFTPNLPEVPEIYGIVPLDVQGWNCSVSVAPTAAQMSVHNPNGVAANFYVWAWCPPRDVR